MPNLSQVKIAFFDAHRFEQEFFSDLNKNYGFAIIYFEPRLGPQTAKLATGASVVCSFANDCLNRETLKILKDEGVKLIALRSAGYNHVDLKAAQEFELTVVRVPAYSPYAVAEHAVALMLALNRRINRAYNRVREGNFSLDGLVGFDLHGKTVGIIGLGRIGSALASIMNGFGCNVLAFDAKPNKEMAKALKIKYVSLKEIYQLCDVISLHVPLTSETRHLVDDQAFSQMKKGVMLINTGRGALIDTTALIRALKNDTLGFAGLDVYEEEEQIFFRDLSSEVLQDDQLARLLTFPNVLITSHQGFLTREALQNIASTTLSNIDNFAKGKPLENKVNL